MSWILREPGPLVLMTFAYWIRADVSELPSAEDFRTAQELQRALRDLGFHAWMRDDGNGDYPILKHWHSGPIEAGMKFIWEPTLDCSQLCEVTRVRASAGAEDGMIWTTSPKQAEVYNDESRFREAAVPLDRCWVRKV